MDDFQHRLLVALERLVGRDGPTPFALLDDRLGELLAQGSAYETGINLLVVRLGQIRERLEDIRDRLPPAGP